MRKPVIKSNQYLPYLYGYKLTKKVGIKLKKDYK
jgi:hypothetical protein